MVSRKFRRMGVRMHVGMKKMKSFLCDQNTVAPCERWCDLTWRERMTTVRMQWIASLVMGLYLLLQGCAVGSSDLQYHLALDTDPAGQKSDCTVVLKSEVDDALNGSGGPVGGSPWTIRDFQIKLERQLHQTVKGLTCNSNKKTPLNEGLKPKTRARARPSRGRCTRSFRTRMRRIPIAIRMITRRIFSTGCSVGSKTHEPIGCATFGFSCWGTKFPGMKTIR